MKRISLLLGLIAISPIALSQEMPSVANLLEQGKDPTKLKSASTALVRCAALIDLTQLINSDIDEKVKKDPANLLYGAVNIRLNVDNLSGKNQEAMNARERYVKSTVNEVKVYFGEYQKWFTKAQKESPQNDYFDDPSLKAEFILCNEVYEAYMEGAKK